MNIKALTVQLLAGSNNILSLNFSWLLLALGFQCANAIEKINRFVPWIPQKKTKHLENIRTLRGQLGDTSKCYHFSVDPMDFASPAQ